MSQTAVRDTSESPQTRSRKWSVRDVVTLVIFNIIIIAVTMVLKMAEDMILSPQSALYLGTLMFSIASTPFYLVMADRIRKPGVLAASIMIFGIIYTFIGGLYCFPVAVVGAIIGEIVMLGRDSYGNIKRVIAGFCVYWITFDFYGIIPFLLFREAYSEQLSTMYAAEDVAALAAQYTDPLQMSILIVATIIGTCIGGFIGAKLLKKHVRKAKIA